MLCKLNIYYICAMKILNTYALLFVIIAMASCKTNNSTIEGTIEGVPNDKLIYTIDPDLKKVDTVLVKDGKFTISTMLTEATPMNMQLLDNKERLTLIADKGKMTITGKIGEFSAAKITGSKDQAILEEYQKILQPFMVKASELAKDMEDTADVQKQMNTQMQFLILDSLADVEAIKLIKANSASPASAFLAYSLITQEKQTLPIINRFIEALQPAALKTIYGKRLTGMLDKMKNLSVGGLAPAFTLKTADGKEVSLSSYKGKYVLVDFWASWCGPCRKENPNVVKAYANFKDKGLEIISVSVDEKAEDWTKAVAKDNLTWVNVRDAEQTAALAYNIVSIPTNYLLDKDGKIVAINLRGENLEAALNNFIK